MKRLLVFALIIPLLLTQCKKEKTEKTVVSNIIYSIGIDSQGNKWFASDLGFYRYDNTAWLQYALPGTDQKVNSLYIKNDTMLLSTLSGALMVKIEGNTISTIDEYNRNQTSIISDTVNVAAFDPISNIWVGSFKGISYLHNNSWLSDNKIIYKLTSSGSNISCIAFRYNDYFFGTYGNSLFHITYDNGTDAISGASHMIKGFNGDLTTDTIFSLYAGVDSFIWIGSSTGLSRNKGINDVEIGGKFDYYLEGQRVHSIFRDSKGNIWAGTENGVFVQNGNSWTNYTTTEGLVNNTVLSMAEDHEGVIWIGTQEGISSYRNGVFTNYTLGK